MKKLLWTCLLALPFFAIPSPVQAWGSVSVQKTCYGCEQSSGTLNFGWWCNGKCGTCTCQAGPWYSYWPYEAHFAAPAPTGCYPWWPGALGGVGLEQGPAVAPAAPAAAIKQSSFQTVGFGGQVPSYWYGR
jgi:hypothetical protein